MKVITILLLLVLNVSFGQSTFRVDFITSWKHPEYDKFDKNSKAFYELKSNVKSAIITETYTINKKKNDTSYKKLITKNQELFFNKSGYLTAKYLFDVNNKKYKNIENYYLKDTILIYQRNKQDYLYHNIKKKIYEVRPDVFHIIEKKYKYNNDLKLLLLSIKSSFQNDFFIKERNTYNKDELLILQENLNNHLFIEEFDSHRCYGDGSSRKNYVSEFSYNRKKQLLSKKIRSVHNYINKIDFYSYSINEYDKKGNRIKNGVSKTKNNITVPKHTTSYKYDKTNRLLERVTKYDLTGRINGVFYEYEEENGDLKRKTFGNIFAEHFAATIKKYASYIYEFNLDDSYTVKVYNYNSTKLNKSFHYDKQQNLTFIKDDESNIVEAYKYTYDKKGNWISVEKTGGVFPGKFTRTIEYY